MYADNSALSVTFLDMNMTNASSKEFGGSLYLKNLTKLTITNS